jgi:putative transposase
VIFKDKQDYIRFVGLLLSCNSNKHLKYNNLTADTNLLDIEKGESIVAIGAYCLMPNHFHILLTPLVEDGVTKFMQKVGTAYSMYFNKKYSRTGGLFEGKFRSQYVGDDVYLKYLFSYIHLNPVKLINPTWKENGLKSSSDTLAYLQKYQYSSYLDFKGVHRKEHKILDIGAFPNYFPTPKMFDSEILSWFHLGKT